MPLQVIGYRFNADQLCRLAKSMVGVERVHIEDAFGHLLDEFEDRPDRYAIELVDAPRKRSKNPLKEEINVVFIICSTFKIKPVPFEELRRLPRMQEAKDFLRERGITEIDDLKLYRKYFD